ncbi:MAG: hypothetical protein MHMPM18_004798 [Marteilia pararefringens]
MRYNIESISRRFYRCLTAFLLVANASQVSSKNKAKPSKTNDCAIRLPDASVFEYLQNFASKHISSDQDGVVGYGEEFCALSQGALNKETCVCQCPEGSFMSYYGICTFMPEDRTDGLQCEEYEGVSGGGNVQDTLFAAAFNHLSLTLEHTGKKVAFVHTWTAAVCE